LVFAGRDCVIAVDVLGQLPENLMLLCMGLNQTAIASQQIRAYTGLGLHPIQHSANGL